MNPKPKKIPNRIHDNLRLKQCSSKSEQAYLNWIKQYILFHTEKHPQVMGTSEVEAFLTCLAVDRNVAAATQNQAFSRAGFYTCPKQQGLSKLPQLRPFPALRAIFISCYPPFY
jgi:hypothetical protein